MSPATLGGWVRARDQGVVKRPDGGGPEDGALWSPQLRARRPVYPACVYRDCR